MYRKGRKSMWGWEMVNVGRVEGLCMEKRWLTPRERTVRMKKENNCNKFTKSAL